jgi:hypothetical protein
VQPLAPASEKVPAEQAVQEAAPAAENVPLAHGEQIAPAAAAVPATQLVHSTAPTDDDVPAMQEKHVAPPSYGLYVPEEHGEQAVAKPPLDTKPAAHARHWPPDLYRPDGHEI